jgi:hypothetical protein
MPYAQWLLIGIWQQKHLNKFSQKLRHIAHGSFVSNCPKLETTQILLLTEWRLNKVSIPWNIIKQ